MYAKNYGSGNAWSPGKVTAVHGSMLVTVKLLDGRSVRKHFDQLISRVESHETGPEVDCEHLDLPQNQDDELPQITSSSNVEVQTTSSETEDTEPPQPSGSGTDSSSNTEPEDREVNPPPPVPRRSNHVRNAPDRLSHNVS